MKTAALYIIILSALMYGAWHLYQIGMEPAVQFPGLKAESIVQSWLHSGLEIVIGIWVFLLMTTLLVGLFSGILVLMIGVGLFVAILVCSILFPFLFPFFALGFSVLLVAFIAKKLRGTAGKRSFKRNRPRLEIR